METPDKITQMKHPFYIIGGLFLLAYITASQFASDDFSDSPVTLNKENPPQILMFGSQTCQYCTVARAFFKKHELPYTEKDIDTSEEARRIFDLMNGRGTPLLIINGQIIHGYDERMIREAL
ncbi:MAG: glutaredoxin family protein [Gammaproteobacteria bacterium]|nr:glutaredoxin family protein [Gammaproteobacteria bacterium]MCW9055122.1 glutaredoxin family protein [Gammaproteobacteria bacterium]